MLDRETERELNEQYRILEAEARTLDALWRTRRRLFGDPETLAILNLTAGDFFELLRQTTLSDLYFRLCSITDPAGGGDRKNCTLARVAEGLELDDDPAAAALFNQLDQKLEGVRLVRNKALGHFDLGFAAGRLAVEDVKTDDVEAALVLIRELLTMIAKALKRGPGPMTMERPQHGVDDLLAWLHMSQRHLTDDERAALLDVGSMGARRRAAELREGFASKIRRDP